MFTNALNLIREQENDRPIHTNEENHIDICLHPLITDGRLQPDKREVLQAIMKVK